MLSMPTEDKLRTLKLHGMLKALQEQRGQQDAGELNFEERLGLLIDREAQERDNRRLTTRLRNAHLRQEACVENIDYTPHRRLDKSIIKNLSSGNWLKDRLNILITGPCGVGAARREERLHPPDARRRTQADRHATGGLADRSARVRSLSRDRSADLRPGQGGRATQRVR